MMGGAQADLARSIEGYRDQMVKTLGEIVAIPSISPLSGGKGEGERAAYLQKALEAWGFEVRRYDYKDDTGASRPNLVVKYGSQKRTLWLLSHTDTVAVGERSLWNTDPFKMEVKGGRMYGRGTNDNGQSLVASIYALKALKDAKAALKYNVGIVLAADEEIGSKYGAQRLVDEGVFGKEDMIIVPDWGTPKGNEIEVAEKGLLWLKVTVKGKQVHASVPNEGINACRVMARLMTRLDDGLHAKFPNTNGMFSPKYSTFEMTKHEKNVDSVNIIPGMEVAYMDCRVLPEYGLDDVLELARDMAEEESKRSGAKIEIEVFNREDAAEPTPSNAEVIKVLSAAIKAQRGLDVKAVGIGGGTVAKFFRDKGIPAAVWSTEEEVAHQPNEYANVKDMVEDAKVFAAIYV